jgi:hypothetical protein
VSGGFRHEFENFGGSYYEMCITMSAARGNEASGLNFVIFIDRLFRTGVKKIDNVF